MVMGSDSLNCYKPQCGAGVKWHMLLREAVGEREKERVTGREREREAGETEPAALACSLTL